METKQKSKIKPIEWLSCKEGLLKLGFSVKEIETAIKKSGLKVEDLTEIKDFQDQRTAEIYKPHEIVKGWHTSSYIRVYENVKIDGQYIQMEGYKTGQVIGVRVKNQYQGLKHEKVIRNLLEKRFKWFKNFKWEIYSFEYQDPENYEIYLKTGKNSLYVPLKALLKKDIKAIEDRNISYLTGYHKLGSYELNKNKGETLGQFKERKNKERKKALRVLNTPTTKRFFEILKK